MKIEIPQRLCHLPLLMDVLRRSRVLEVIDHAFVQLRQSDVSTGEACTDTWTRTSWQLYRPLMADSSQRTQCVDESRPDWAGFVLSYGTARCLAEKRPSPHETRSDGQAS